MPTQLENFSFFMNYQVNHMYWRYFLWNFVGRQNDIQGNGEKEHGNWLTGISLLDEIRLGNLDKARDSYEYALDLDENNLEARSRIATTYVADHDFTMALEYANQIIDEDETHSSALATAAICHGLLGDPVMSNYYTKQAVEYGYSQKKIEETIATLKKRVK